MHENSLNKKERMIFSLLFSTKVDFEIDIQNFCRADTRSEFKEEIRIILKKGGISITEDRIMHRDDAVIWKLTLKR